MLQTEASWDRALKEHSDNKIKAIAKLKQWLETDLISTIQESQDPLDDQDDWGPSLNQNQGVC